jgi:hypothetical protein
MSPISTLSSDRSTAVEVDAMSISEFCVRHGISKPTYFGLRKLGLAPDEIRIGAIIRISCEAAARWRAERERPAGAEAEQVACKKSELQKRSKVAARTSVASAAHVSNVRRRGEPRR